MDDKQIKVFVEERNEILMRMDVSSMRKLCRKYGIECPIDDIIMDAGMHKARMCLSNIPVNALLDSLKWLTDNGFTTP